MMRSSDAVYRTLPLQWRRITALLTLAGEALLLTGCGLGQASSPFTPVSPQARSIATLFWVVLAIAGLIFLLVQGMLLYMAVRFRSRGEAGEPRQTANNRSLEITWTVLPVLVLAGVFVLMLPVMSAAPTVTSGRVTVEVVGHQWWWELRYPDLGVITANELHLPAGEPVLLRLRSADVIHSFWVPRLAGKTDLIPGKTNEMWVQAETPGVYLGQCAEFCGLQHAGMLQRVLAEPRADFDAWAIGQRAPAALPSTAAQPGHDLFFGETCGNCHTIQGSPAQGTAGPDLTHLGSRQTLAAGVLQNTPDQLRNWLRDPQQIKPGTMMPNFRLSDNEVAALADYLEGLR